MSTTALESVAWDLDPLVDGDGEAGADRLLEESDRRASAFSEQHAGKVADLDGPGLAAAVAELAEISELVGRAGNYAMLRFAVDTADPANGALLQRVQELGTVIETKLLFFDLEWAALPDERAEELLGADGLDHARHHLRTARRYRPHLLTEAEEKIMSEKSVTGGAAWSRLFSEVTSAIKVELDGEDEPVALDVALSRLMSPDRALRQHVAERVTDRAAADAADQGLHLQHADGRQGHRRPPARATRRGSRRATSPTRPPTSRSRRWSRRSARPMRSRGAGTASRRACSASSASPTTTAWRRSAATRSTPTTGTRPRTSC